MSCLGASLRTNAGQLDNKIAGLNQLEETWKQTLTLAQTSVGTPPEVLQRMNTVSPRRVKRAEQLKSKGRKY